MTRNRSDTNGLVLLALTTLLSGAGCAQFGPEAIQDARLDYNEVINNTTNEQLLLNLVRLRYRDTPLFIDIRHVVTSFQFQAGISAGGNPKLEYPTSLNPRLGYAELPSILYAPLQGSAYTKQVLTPLNTDAIALLYHSGWGVDQILLCCVQMMNGVENASTGTRPNRRSPPVYKEFFRAAEIMGELQDSNKLQLGTIHHKTYKGLGARIEASVWETEAGRELADLLGIKPGEPFYPITTDGSRKHPNNIGLSTRSLLATMSYLSRGVTVPEKDTASGRAPATVANDSVFDWSAVTGRVMSVANSRVDPGSAAVKARCRGAWFYIDDTDDVSKSTFYLLSQLFQLQAGSARAGVPVLTL